LILKWKITKQYLIVRAILATEAADEEKTFLLFHEDNEASHKGISIQEGIPYPIDEDIPITIRYGKNKKTFTFLELKEKADRPIVFEDDFAALSYELYD
jgi:hypothetical protein